MLKGLTTLAQYTVQMQQQRFLQRTTPIWHAEPRLSCSVALGPQRHTNSWSTLAWRQCSFLG